MTITVTRSDIEFGRRCDPDCCPVGRALSRAGVEHYGVFGTKVMISDGQEHVTGLPLPNMVHEWLLEFDGHSPVEPISFDLPVLPHKAQKDTSRKHKKKATRSAVAA